MARWIFTFLILTFTAGCLGFGGWTGKYTPVAQILTVIFAVLLEVSIFYSIITRRGRRGPLP